MLILRIYVDQELREYVAEHPFDPDLIEIDHQWHRCRSNPTVERINNLQDAIDRVNAKNVGIVMLLDAPIIMNGDWHA